MKTTLKMKMALKMKTTSIEDILKNEDDEKNEHGLNIALPGAAKMTPNRKYIWCFILYTYIVYGAAR